MTEMSLTRILSRLKVLKKQIPVVIKESLAVDILKGSGDRRRLVSSSRSIADTEFMIKSSHQKVISLQNEFYKLNSKLLVANATTMVTINGIEMSIAEAINKKSTIIHKLEYCRQLQQKFVKTSNAVNRENDILNTEIERSIDAAYSNDSGNISKELYEAIAEPKRKENEAKLLDPLGVENLIEKLKDETDGFLNEVDYVLSEVNALTKINID